MVVVFSRLVVFCLALGFLVVGLRGVVDFLGFARRLGSSNGKLSTNICLLGGLIPVIAIPKPRKDRRTGKRLHEGLYNEKGLPVCIGGQAMNFLETGPDANTGSVARKRAAA